MDNTALLIVDMQQGVCKPESYHLQETIHKINALIEASRNAAMPIIFVRHDDGDGEALTKGKDAWNIINDFQVAKEDFLVDKHYNSAFLKTPLDAFLKEKAITTLILCGMQSEYCVDATIKSAFERGYQVIVPKGCTTTLDQTTISAGVLCDFYEETIWNHRFADVIEVEDILNLM